MHNPNSLLIESSYHLSLCSSFVVLVLRHEFSGDITMPMANEDSLGS